MIVIYGSPPGNLLAVQWRLPAIVLTLFLTQGIDLIAIRENTEGEYSSLEHESVSGVVESLKIITREKSMRIAKFAFDYAREHNRKKVTCIHKANIMKLSDGLFKACCKEVRY